MLVTFDVVQERWRNYPIEDCEVVFTTDGAPRQGQVIWGTGGDCACMISRREKTWRYAYNFGAQRVRGIASIAPSAGLGRARVLAHLRGEARAE